MLKRAFSWIFSNADTLIALIMATAVSILDLVGGASSALVGSATVATLAVVAFILLHDRKLQHQTRKAVERLEGGISAKNPIRELTGTDITQAIVDAYQNSNHWYYRGPTATYVRAAVLPDCMKRARADDTEFRVRLEILDPTSVVACERHVRLYRELAEDIGEIERRRSVKTVQIELYATIVAVCWHKRQYAKFFAEVGLSENVSTFRWEASSNYFILTRRERRFPAILIKDGDPLYPLLSSELEISFRQTRRVPLEEATGAQLSDEPSVLEVRDLLSRINLALPDSFGDDDVLAIIDKALHSKNRYRDSRP